MPRCWYRMTVIKHGLAEQRLKSEEFLLIKLVQTVLRRNITAVFSYQKSRKNWSTAYEGVYLLTALFIALFVILE